MRLRGVRSNGRFCAGVLAGLLVATGGARGAPLIQIRARTHLEIAEAREQNGSFVVRGRLVDDASAAGIADRTVEVAFTAPGGAEVDRETASTDASGSFEVEAPLALGGYGLAATFAGDGPYAPAPDLRTTVDVSKGALHLTMTVPAVVPGAQGKVVLSVGADADGAPQDVAVDVVERAADGTTRLVTSVLTGATGHGDATVPTTLLAPGRHALEARFAGDSRFNPAAAYATVDVYRGTAITLAAGAPEAYADQRIELGGALTAGGTPLAGQAITIEVDSRAAASALTGPDGRFHVSLAAADLPGGRIDLQARCTSGDSTLGSATSEPVLLRIRPPRPFPVRVLLVPLVAILAATLAVAIARRRPLAWLSRRRRQARPVAVARVTRSRLPPLARLARATDRGFAGTLWDGAFARPAGEGVVRVETPAGPVEARAGGDGGFALEELPPGSHRGVATVPGYADLPFSLTIPHRGELRGARLVLVPLRTLVLEAHQAAGRRVLDPPSLYPRLTPREVAGRAPGPALEPLSRLTGLLEEAYYSGRPPEPAAVDQARALAAAITTAPPAKTPARR